jgi:alcohol dehydrogenase
VTAPSPPVPEAAPVPVRFGAGAIRQLPEVLAGRQARRVLLVCGETAFAACGIGRLIGERLGAWRLDRFSCFTANPELADLERGVELARHARSDTVVAIGGGTAMDLAKGIAILAGEPAPPAAYVARTQQLSGRRRLSLVLAPTTAGTGSEVTRFLVVYRDRVKRSLDHAAIAADAAVVDPQLTWSMPPRLTAVTGMDALCQAVESYWSIHSTAASRRLAARAIRLVLANLEAACRAPGPAARTAMSRAALLAGRAIDITRTTAAHAVSYPLTGLYGIAHGHACALTLPHFVAYNARVGPADVLDPRGPAFVLRRMRELYVLLGVSGPRAARTRLAALLERLGLEPNLAALGLDGEDRRQVAALALASERAANNPRRLTPRGLRRILEAIR